MITYAEYIRVGKLRIVTWILPGFTNFLIREANLKHLFGPFFFELN